MWGSLDETLLQTSVWRAVLASHVFTAVAVLTLARQAGDTPSLGRQRTALAPAAFPDAERLVMLWEVSPGGRHQNTTSRANFLGWREQSTAFEGMAAFSDQRLSLSGNGDPEEVSVQLATPELFRVLGVAPVLGRGITQEDARPGAPEVAVLTRHLAEAFGGDPTVVGKRITLNGSPFTVVGVLPAGFSGT